MRLRIGDPRSFIAGLLFLAIGGGAASVAQDYRLGSALHMGPGYYPFAVGLLLALAGLGAMLRALVVRHGPETESGAGLALRPALVITAAVLAFALLVDRAGLVPATLLATGIAGLGARPARPLQTAALAAALALLAVGIFIYGLKLPLTVFG